jgi:hypothetical protein
MIQKLKISEGMKEKLFEIALFLVGLIGLLILFTVLYQGPRFILNRILEYFGFSV